MNPKAVATTAVLPESLRIKFRGGWLRSLQAGKTENAGIIVINHPKTGGTWFRVMLSRLYQTHYQLPPRRIVKSDEFYNFDQSMPHFLISNGYYAYESATQDVLDRPESADKKVMLLARNPLDVAVSWYLQFTGRTKAYKREMINSTLKNPVVDLENISMWDFVMHEELGLRGIINFHNVWAEKLATRDNSMIMKYEDLRNHPIDTMTKVVEFIGADPGSFPAQESGKEPLGRHGGIKQGRQVALLNLSQQIAMKVLHM